MVDRHEIKPDFFRYASLDDVDGGVQFMRDTKASWGDRVQWARFTVFNDKAPSNTYPHGWYAEGWSVAPHKMEPPGTQAPFCFPLTEANCG